MSDYFWNKDTITSSFTVLKISARDRIKLLFGAKFRCKFECKTENEAGRTEGGLIHHIGTIPVDPPNQGGGYGLIAPGSFVESDLEGER